MATRCTTIEQFVATFHRFCGDDQTFFVATMTSRPVGLETAFSIQLADKQPVLRGMCVVLDAWATPENRYKRPGIRLGIKRLTADSEPVFERLRAAARAPVAMAEATPAPGPLPGPPSLQMSALSSQEMPALASATGELPTLATATSELPAIASAPAASAPRSVAAPVVASAKPIDAAPLPRVARRPGAPPPLPPLVTPRTGLPSVRTAPVPDVKPPPLPPIAIKPPPVQVVPPVEVKPVEAKPAPIEVTRFQVALNVDTIPPPISDVEFKAAPLVAKPRVEPRIISDAPPEEPVDPGSPAMIVDRPSGEIAPLIAHPPVPPPEQRTPGSELILPANPLHDLTDESLEGFVDCTLYEETGNFFHPGLDPAFTDELADPPAAPLSTRSVPAMPFDEPPDLAVRTIGETESLRVAPAAVEPAPTSTAAFSAPPPAEHQPPPISTTFSEPPMSPAAFAVAPPTGYAPPPMSTAAFAVQPPAGYAPPPISTGAFSTPPPADYAPSPDYPPAEHAPIAPPMTASFAAPPTFAPQMTGAFSPHTSVYAVPDIPRAMSTIDMGPPVHTGPFPAADPAFYQRYEPPPLVRRSWHRPLIIGGTAFAAIVIAFLLARLARGTPPVVTPPIKSRSTAAAQPAPAPPPAPPPTEPATRPAIAPDEDGDATGPAVVGHGPCRFTVATTPAGSLVRLDDQPMGPSPLTIDATCDRHRIDVSHARYQPVSRTVTLSADKPTELDISLPRPTHSVTVTSQPSGAELSIDGHRAGTTPTIIQMMGFSSVNLTFTKAGYQTVTRKVYSKTADDHVSVKLTR